jgi:hypothetical protein
VKLPFSALNQQPGISGLQDVDLPIGDVLGIVQDIQDTVFSTDDLLELLEGDAQQALEDATPIDEIADAITGGGEGAVGIGLQDVIDEIVSELESTQAVIIANIDNAQNQIELKLEQELDDISVTVSGVEIDEDELADELEDELDIPPTGGTTIRFESVFGAVANDIIESFEIALDSTIGTADELPDELETVFQALAAVLDALDDVGDIAGEELIIAIQGAVVQEILAQPGAELLEAPDAFIDQQVSRVTDGLVDASAQQNLQQSIEEAG